ncbi:MAG TPA: hypothetical protein ENN38_05685 [Actinobacteria bacterium]|nr:hypothetical protein [Actinomycetota bacterium]
MSDLVDKGITTFFALWLLAHELADDFIRDTIEKGKMTPEEKKKFLDEFAVRVEEGKEELKKSIPEITSRALKEVGLVPAEEVEKLKVRIDELEEKIASRENQ